MKSYHFDIGNSSTGPLGLCGRIKAETKEEALYIFRNRLWAFTEGLNVGEDNDEGYIEVYFNPDHITVNDIDDEDEAE